MDVQPLVGKQRESVRLATARGNVWEGAVRSSKTVCSILAWLQYVRTGPAGPLMMTGKTERTLLRNVIDPIVEMVGPKRCQFRIGAGEVELFGRKIYVSGGNDERAADKVKGLTLAGLYCDEITTYPKSYFAMLLTRLSVAGGQWYGTTNPAGSGHWFKKDYLDRAKLHITRDGEAVVNDGPDALNLHRFSFQIFDNPTLSPEFVAALVAENVGIFYRRNVEGSWCSAEGAVYDMFDEDRHVVDDDKIPHITRWLALGIDYGTVAPLAAHLIGIGTDRRLYIVGEWYYDSRIRRRSKTDAEYSADLRDWLDEFPIPHTDIRGVRPDWTCVDPSAASFITQLWRDGLTPTPARNEVVDGIRTVSSLLARDRLRVVSTCRHLIDEFPGYSWSDKHAAKGEDVPVKVDDHCLAAGTMVTTSRGAVPIERVRAGDLVATRAGWRPVVRAWLASASAQVSTVVCSNGATLTGTGEHRIWTDNRGWVRIDSLAYGDNLSVCPTSMSFGTEESYSAAIPTPPTGPSGPTTSPASPTDSGASAGSTRRSGATSTDPSPRGITSTTLTTIRSTTTLTTWDACPPRNTALTTPRVGPFPDEPPNGWHASNASAHWPPNGTGVQRDWLGTPSTAGAYGTTESPRNGTATSAAAPTTRRASTVASGSAPTSASPPSVVPAESMTSIASALTAGRPSESTGTPRPPAAPSHVVCVSRGTAASAVYDLTVAGCPEFYANGILVHNCLDDVRYGLFTTEAAWRPILDQPIVEAV